MSLLTSDALQPRLPAVRLRDISPSAWEHPADSVALQTLRSIPGFDDVVRLVVGSLGERGVRLLFQANAVRVGPAQLPRLHALFDEAVRTLDCDEKPELYVSQTPYVNAGAYGVDRPFIVVHSGTLDLLTDDEIAFVLGHELGHVMSGHALYHTLLVLVLSAGLGALPAVAEFARLPIRLTLLEWYRKSELSCDRAGLLATQNPHAALSTFLKLASGARHDQLDLAAFLEQAREYEAGTGAMDRVFKLMNTIGQSHPFHTLRATELDRWIRSGEYDVILGGRYHLRGDEAPRRSIADDIGKVRDHYVAEAKAAVGEVVVSARDAARTFREAIRGLSRSYRR